MLWTNKYSPKRTSEIIGQEKAVKELKDFIVNFKNQKRKAAILFGPIGCGKNVAVSALAQELHYELFEINASDIRNEEAIYTTVGNAIKQRSFFFKEKIISIDELDGISGKEDFGGLTAISNLIKETQVPIVLILNDPWDSRFAQIRKLSKLIEFRKLSSDSIYSVLKKICEMEHLTYEQDALLSLAIRSGGDLRAAINDLQICANKGRIIAEQISTISERDRDEKVEQALLKIFKTKDIKIAISAFEHLDEDFDKLILWIDENMPKEYRFHDLESAYNYLSLADIYNRRIKRRQDWRYLFYINAFLSAGIALSKERRNQNIVNYVPAQRMLKIWIANQKNAKKKAIAEKLSEAMHCSTKKTMKIIPYIHIMCKKSKNEKISEELGLEIDERDWSSIL